MVSLLGGGLLGNPLSGTLGGDKGEKEEKKGEGDEEEDPEIAEAKREAEEKRNEKYRKMEEEREVVRQGIRDKYNIPKKEIAREDPGPEVRAIGRKKNPGDESGSDVNGTTDEATSQQSVFPKNFDDLTNKVKELPGTVMTTVSGATEKCSVQ